MNKEIKITLTKEEFETIADSLDMAQTEADYEFEIEELRDAIKEEDWEVANHITWKKVELKNANKIIDKYRKVIEENEKSEDKYKGNDYGL